METIKFMLEKLPIILRALPTTLELLFISVFIAFILGILLTCAKVSKNKISRGISSIYISLMRGTPMITQVLIAFICIPLICRDIGINTNGWNNMVYALVAFSLNEAAFFAEIFRASYLDIDKGQIEAAQSIGMTEFQTFRRIILPQVAAKALPNTTNMIIELMKNTSLGMAIGVVDMLGMAKQITYNSYGIGQTEVFIMTGILYWIMGIIFISISNYFYKKLNKFNSFVVMEKKRNRIKVGKEEVA